jgi:AcrR family transcriptional regulator
MRVRTEDRRRAIVQAAIELFRDVGYERASMAMISERVGGSKTTLYGYFPSKEELFAAAMVEALREQGEEAIEILDPSDPDIPSVLRRFGEAYHRILLSSDSLALTRTAIAEATNQKLGPVLYKLGPNRVLSVLATYMAQLRTKGALRPVDPHLAAVHLHGLYDAGVLIPYLFGAKPELKSKEAIRAAVDAFWSAYCTEVTSASRKPLKRITP